MLGSILGGAVAGVANSLFNNASAISMSQRDYRYAKQLQEYQNEWNLAQWNRENEYNSPTAIMSRYADAGLNPNLIYGNNGISASHLESAGANAQTKGVAPARFDLLAAYNLDAQNELLKAQKEEVNARKNLIETQNLNWEHDHSNQYKDLIEVIKGVFSNDGGSSGRKESRVVKKLREAKKEMNKNPLMVPGGFGNPFALFSLYDYDTGR